MNFPPSEPVKANLCRGSILLVACLAAATAWAQPSPPVSLLLFSDEPPGLFCGPPGASADQVNASCGRWKSWLESGKAVATLKAALAAACSGLAGPDASACNATITAPLDEFIHAIETVDDCIVICSSMFLFQGQSAAYVPSCGAPFTLLAGAQYSGRTYAGRPGTATLRFDVSSAAGPWAYLIVYTTTAAPLTTFQGCDGTAYAVRAIMYSESQPTVPASSRPALAALAVAVLLFAVFALRRLAG